MYWPWRVERGESMEGVTEGIVETGSPSGSWAAMFVRVRFGEI